MGCETKIGGGKAGQVASPFSAAPVLRIGLARLRRLLVSREEYECYASDTSCVIENFGQIRNPD